MKAYCILYNPLAATGHGEDRAHKLDTILGDCHIEYKNLLDISDMRGFFEALDPDTTPVLTGGAPPVPAMVGNHSHAPTSSTVMAYPPAHLK